MQQWEADVPDRWTVIADGWGADVIVVLLANGGASRLRAARAAPGRRHT
ncbi:hypothetical protein [Streptomyces sp. 147326]